MRKAIIYTRVSTDDQKDNGFSLQEQFRQLTVYCEQKGYTVIKHYQDDHSAKDFTGRPQFQQFLEDLKKKVIKPDIFLVTKIDRFSRDLYETISMAGFFKYEGIELCSIAEGFFDFSDPHKYFTNVIQSASAHFFNLQLGDNTKRGMREAMREGRYVQRAPIGYVDNKTTKIKEIDPVQGPLIKEAFELLSTGAYSAEEVLNKMKGKGLKCSKQTFLNAIRRIFYAGIIVIPAWKDEPEEKVKGTYEPLITEDLFYKVQDVLNGRRRKFPSTVCINDQLPLRGHLICPSCGHNLTGSGSIGRDKSKKHHYYHCQKKYDCNVRFPAELANDNFYELLQAFNIKQEMISLYFEILKDVFKADDTDRRNQVAKIDKEIEHTRTGITTLQDKLIFGGLEQKDFNQMKLRYEKKEEELILQRTHLTMDRGAFAKYFDYSLPLLYDLPEYYKSAGVEVKQKIIGSIFPEKLIYDGKKYRTTKVNDLLSLLTSNINDLGGIQKRKADIFCQPVQLGSPQSYSIEPILQDLKQIYALSAFVKVKPITEVIPVKHSLASLAG